MREYSWTFDLFSIRVGWIKYYNPNDVFVAYEPQYSTFRIYKLEFYKY